MSDRIPVIDLFAGPGGLGEGFSASLDDKGQANFRIRLSIEMESEAHQTLQLRSFFRQFAVGEVPDEYYELLRGSLDRNSLFEMYPKESEAARGEAWRAELGKVDRNEVSSRIREHITGGQHWVLCGGPPCQAFSVIGRSRRGGIDKDDPRVYLYREYLETIAANQPSVFIMENVKGLLSSSVSGSEIFSKMLSDLSDPGAAINSPIAAPKYIVVPLTRSRERRNLFGDLEVEPSDFVVRAERFGVPQRRHRVILIGIREDLAKNPFPRLEEHAIEIPIWRVLKGLPRLRSGLTGQPDNADAWLNVIRSTPMPEIESGVGAECNATLRDRFEKALIRLRRGSGRGANFLSGSCSVDYRPDWYNDERIGGVCNHQSRAHMVSDLHRYLFAAVFGDMTGRSPGLKDFPASMMPRHKNVTSDPGRHHFEDRFRVQVRKRTGSTVTSHVAKDGHYYIHYDPRQCRSLTVREVARIQTFPDNYLFCGTRTGQYRQVGNAFPPLLAHQIAGAIGRFLRSATGSKVSTSEPTP